MLAEGELGLLGLSQGLFHRLELVRHEQLGIVHLPVPACTILFTVAFRDCIGQPCGELRLFGRDRNLEDVGAPLLSRRDMALQFVDLGEDIRLGVRLIDLDLLGDHPQLLRRTQQHRNALNDLRLRSEAGTLRRTIKRFRHQTRQGRGAIKLHAGRSFVGRRGAEDLGGEKGEAGHQENCEDDNPLPLAEDEPIVPEVQFVLGHRILFPIARLCSGLGEAGYCCFAKT